MIGVIFDEKRATDYANKINRWETLFETRKLVSAQLWWIWNNFKSNDIFYCLVENETGQSCQVFFQHNYDFY